MGRAFGNDSREVFSREDIKSMTTDEIHKCMAHFKKLIREGRVSGKNTQEYEIEYCYLDNESQIRSKYEFSRPSGSPDRRHRNNDNRNERNRS
tara:strand:- start:159 stop:437 length:279 start_codon:yes stop_codon:yes gene_type:complete